jgi:hypothetical protein
VHLAFDNRVEVVGTKLRTPIWKIEATSAQTNSTSITLIGSKSNDGRPEWCRISAMMRHQIRSWMNFDRDFLHGK